MRLWMWILAHISFPKQVNTERAIRHAIQERLPIVVVINKVFSLFPFDTRLFKQYCLWMIWLCFALMLFLFTHLQNFNQVDRLINELKLPPKDAYHKLRHLIEAINTHITAASSTAGDVQVIEPTLGYVCFASAAAGWSFTLQSFVNLYAKLQGIPFDANKIGTC